MFVYFLICFLESGMEKLAIMPLLSTVVKNVGFRETLGLSLGDPVALVVFLPLTGAAEHAPSDAAAQP